MASCTYSWAEEVVKQSTTNYTSAVHVSTLNDKAAAEIPPYSIINNVTVGFEGYQTIGIGSSSGEARARFVDNDGNTVGGSNVIDYFDLPKGVWVGKSGIATNHFATSGKDCGKVSSGAYALYFQTSSMIMLNREYRQRNRYVTWDFTPSTFVISLSAGTGGTVQGAGTYTVRSTAVIKATPNKGYRFVRWSDGNQNAERHITVNDNDISANVTNLSYSAVFEPADNDLNYDNLLSFSTWANSRSSSTAPGCSGTFTTDKTAGTVTAQGSGDFYTLYYTGDSSLYYIPVQAGQQYLFRFDADIMGGVQAYVFYFNDSYATVNNASGVYFDGIYGSNNLYFTPPSGCTKITFRIGTTNGVKTTFSNLAIYKTSWNTHEITNRQYRKVFTVGNELGILYEPERPGYVFQGWYTGENGTGDLIRKIDYNGSRPVLSGNTTVYSHWKKRNYYDVNYDNLFSFSDWAYSPSGAVNGLSDSAYIGTISTDIPNGTVTVKGADPNGSAFYTAYGAFSPYHHIPVVAGQQYAFRYNVSQTYNMQAFVFFCNDNQDFVTDPSTGLQFVFDTNGNDLVFIPPAGCTNVCFRLGVGGINTAVFSNIGLYKVNNEQGITNRPIRKNISYGSAVGTLSTPSKEGYTFKGWYTVESGSGAEIKSSDSFIKGVTAYSAWTKLHTVTFKDENGATLKTEAVADGSTTTPPSNPTKADTAQWDYTFDGWYDAIGNKWTSDTVITSDTVFTARYTAVVQKYTITASGTNGTVTGGGTYDYNSNVTLTATPNSGYKFKQWSDGVTSATRTVTVTGAATYTAVFELIPPEIKLVQMIYLDKQISATNKVPCGEGFIISVELS